MEINVFFEKVEEFDFGKTILNKIGKMCHEENREIGDLNIIFCSDDYIYKMNKEYLEHDYYTDVISFNYNENNIINGDIFISIDTVSFNANKYNVSFENELYRVMIHGVLHLIGYNDKTNKEKTIMKSKEDYYLQT